MCAAAGISDTESYSLALMDGGGGFCEVLWDCLSKLCCETCLGVFLCLVLSVLERFDIRRVHVAMCDNSCDVCVLCCAALLCYSTCRLTWKGLNVT